MFKIYLCSIHFQQYQFELQYLMAVKPAVGNIAFHFISALTACWNQHVQAIIWRWCCLPLLYLFDVKIAVLIMPFHCSAYRSRPGHLLASNNEFLLVGTYALRKDPRIDSFCVWGNEIFMNKHQVRKLIRIISKKIRMVARKLFVYALSNTPVSCRMVTINSAAFSFYYP